MRCSLSSSCSSSSSLVASLEFLDDVAVVDVKTGISSRQRPDFAEPTPETGVGATDVLGNVLLPFVDTAAGRIGGKVARVGGGGGITRTGAGGAIIATGTGGTVNAGWTTGGPRRSGDVGAAIEGEIPPVVESVVSEEKFEFDIA